MAALLLVVLFYFLPNIQVALVDKKTFGQSEDLSLNPVEISVEATQTTLEKLKIINNHILSVAVRPVSYTHLDVYKRQEMKILFISLGCDKNLVDSEVMLGLLTKHGYTLTDDETQADVIVINTCCFIHDAKEESINTILEMAQYKEQNRCV